MKTALTQIVTPLSYRDMLILVVGIVFFTATRIFFPTIHGIFLFLIALSGILCENTRERMIDWSRTMILMLLFSTLGGALTFSMVEQTNYLATVKVMAGDNARFFAAGLVFTIICRLVIKSCGGHLSHEVHQTRSDPLG